MLVITQNAADSAVIANEIRPVVAESQSEAQTADSIVDNRVDAGRQGLGFTRVNFFIDWFGDASTEVVIANNVFTGLICKRSSSARTA